MRSVKVVLPASMCAAMPMFRVRSIGTRRLMVPRLVLVLVVFMVTPLVFGLDVATRPHSEGNQESGHKKPRWLTSRRQRGESEVRLRRQTAVALLPGKETNFR